MSTAMDRKNPFGIERILFGPGNDPERVIHLPPVTLRNGETVALPTVTIGPLDTTIEFGKPPPAHEAFRARRHARFPSVSCLLADMLDPEPPSVDGIEVIEHDIGHDPYNHRGPRA